jgi:YHS domain-containing protein
MKVTRNLIAILAIASFTSAFASDNRLAARYPKASAYNAKSASTSDKPPTPATNVQCPVMGGKVDASSSIVTVEGNQYRVCCPECVDKIKADPRHFLNSDGTVTGAWENNSYVNHL